MSETDRSDDEADASDAAAGPPWDAVEVLRRRAAEARRERDAAIRDLRDTMSDDEILEEFGIDLKALED